MSTYEKAGQPLVRDMASTDRSFAFDPCDDRNFCDEEVAFLEVTYKEFLGIPQMVVKTPLYQ